VSNRSALWTPVTGLALGVGIGTAAWAVRSSAEASADDYRFFDELIEVKHLISSRFIEKPDEAKLREGAIKGMVEALDDPYTVYVPASERREFNKNLTGEYVGIGAQVNMQSGWLTIVSPLEDSPAWRVGLMPDDKVLEIDGKSTQGLTVEECVDLLTGTPGTSVKLLIERDGQKLTQEITREKIKTRSVRGFHRDEANPQAWLHAIDPARKIAYVRVSQFTPNVSKEVKAALDGLGAGKGELKGLVLDLRFNPGGLLSEAEELADMFLREGIIVSTKGRAYEDRVTRARAEGTYPEFPIVVMLNQESASASEVLAGALVENNRAIILGTRSYGKGSVQSLINLEEGGGAEIKLTEQGYYLPSGRSISRQDDSPTWGVDPSPGFFVPMADKEILEMLTVRRKLDLLAKVEAGTQGEQTAVDWKNTDGVLEALKDKQLTAAVRAIQARVDTGEWKKTGEEGPALGKISTQELTRALEIQERLERELVRNQKRIEALEKGAGVTASATDFWPDEVDLSGGLMEIKDKDGKVIATLRITGNNLERWLLDADVEKPAEAAPGNNVSSK